MKLIIAGGRDYVFTPEDVKRLDELLATHPITEIVSGGAPGADTCGEAWAKMRGFIPKVFEAKWHQLRLAAGPIRNAEMAEYADAVVLFPGNKGTASMYREAKKRGLLIFDWRNG